MGAAVEPGGVGSLAGGCVVPDGAARAGAGLAGIGGATAPGFTAPGAGSPGAPGWAGAFTPGTFKLKFGHHGANHPVKNLLTQKIEITSQNHGFCVDPESLPSSDVELTHLNLNDHTNEGMRHRSLPFFSVQYHPEASPGPHDARYLFDQFIHLMETHKRP